MVNGIIIARVTEIHYVSTTCTALSSPVEAGAIFFPLTNLGGEAQRDKACSQGHSIIEGRAWI